MSNFKARSIPLRYQPGFMRELDKRTDTYMRLTAAYEQMIDDLGGNYSALSHTTLSLVERFIWTEEMIRTLELRIHRNPKLADDLVGKIIQASNSLQGLAAKIGLKKAAAPVSALKVRLAGA